MFSLRYYQYDARLGIRTQLERYRSTACVMPTGTGKTETYLSIAVEEVGRVLVLVHRDYLITSPVERLRKVGFTDVAVEKGNLRAERGGKRSQIVFASVQSIGPESQSQRLSWFDPREFSLVIVDEGHRAVSASYRRVLDYFQSRNPNVKVIVFTATPKRKDGVALGTVCESVGYEMSPGQAAEEGWIVPPRFFVRDVPDLDYSHVKMKGGDLDPDQQAEILLQEKPLHKVCASLAEDQGPTIVFCPKVAVAEAYATMMNKRYRIGKALAIHQGSSDEDMFRVGKGLADGSLDYVFNVDKLTEGFDVPRVIRVAWAGQTASLVRWTQGCGRAFRPDGSISGQLVGGREDAPARRLLIQQSAKPFCSIVTFAPSNCQHQICSAVDLLGGKELGGDVGKFAGQVQNETARQEGGSNTEEDIETAKTFVDLRAVVEEKRKHLKVKAKVQDTEYDGLGGGRKQLRDNQGYDAGDTDAAVAASWGNGEQASEKQVKWLMWKGVPRSEAVVFTKWRAVVVRDLFEMGVKIETASGWGKRQALKVRDKMKSERKQEVPA